MVQPLLVVESFNDLGKLALGCPVIHVDDYLTVQEYYKKRDVQVINLCRSYKYLSTGYYTSLLAEARKHRVIPSVKTILDVSSKSLYSLDTEDLHDTVDKALKKQPLSEDTSTVNVEVFFGRCAWTPLQDFARQVFEIFPLPLMQLVLKRQHTWELVGIRPLTISKLSDTGKEFFVDCLNNYLKRRWRTPKQKTTARYDLAILHNPEDKQPPSNKKALEKFIKAGKKLSVDVELINRQDFSKLGEYDALFIRDTTRINHYTYRFAKKAESEGMPVIDDPTSILRCTNKVYLAELLKANRVPTLKTAIVGKGDLKAAMEMIDFPMVLKVPDGAFSQGVFKASNEQELKDISERLFKTSELILAQEFFYTPYDWRIGVLNGKPLYASQYFMSGEHWQIVKYESDGRYEEGRFMTWELPKVPQEIVDTALKACNLIGSGLYGVDLKANDNGVFVIEVNDNPNLDAGVEDAVLKDDLYSTVIAELVRRLDESKSR